jgi:hypothetical protein
MPDIDRIVPKYPRSVRDERIKSNTRQMNSCHSHKAHRQVTNGGLPALAYNYINPKG